MPFWSSKVNLPDMEMAFKMMALWLSELTHPWQQISGPVEGFLATLARMRWHGKTASYSMQLRYVAAADTAKLLLIHSIPLLKRGQ